MVKKTLLLLALLAMISPLSRAAANPWSNLKKIYIYDFSGDIAALRENLAELDIQGLTPGETNELLQKLNELGDRYYKKKNYPLAEAFYQKILLLAPANAWPLFNKLEKIARNRGNFFWNFRNIGRQFALVVGDFSAGFLLLSIFFDVLLFSGLLLFFLTAAALFIRYFKLLTHDFILGGNSRFQIKKLAILLVFLLWPLLILGGWAFYPFLLCGVMWFYFDHDEKRNIQRIAVILLVFSFIAAIGNTLEKSLQSPGFQTIKNIYAGRLYPEKDYARFDNEVKVMQAAAYFRQHGTEPALDVLQATGNQYQSTLKLNLLGSIYFKKRNFPQSIHYYRQSLSLDSRNQVTLKNFTLALLENEDPDLFELYQKSYPEIREYRDQITVAQVPTLPDAVLWKRLLNFSQPKFQPLRFLSGIGVEFLKIPVLLACLLMLGYISLLKRLSPNLGQSTFCHKCSKIIKKKSIEQAHALCEDCYQLFLIKDPIFFEAKVIKEREIGRKSRLQYSLSLLLSLFVPGFSLNFKNKSHIFTPAFLLFANVFGFFLIGAVTCKSFFGTIPMFINFIGMLAVILYVAINAYALLGDDHGF
ncbi:MAG TPA: hypothetical protein VLQ89_03600 [Candidatus Binatia bacterium]|nr:hypothetical protein [Candidatus Binatia bacterium]